MKTPIDHIQDMIQDRVELNVPMDRFTSIRAGGLADMVITPANVEELAELVRFLAERGIFYLTLGAGSATIARDAGVRGAIFDLKPNFSTIEPVATDTGLPAVRLGAGLTIAELTDWACLNGFSGLEFLAGIPGTVGGALMNNASGWGKYFGDAVIEVSIMDAAGNVVTLPHQAISFSESRAAMPEKAIVLSVTLRGMPSIPEQVQRMSEDFMARREANYPLGQNCIGLVFKPVEGQQPERLIEACGLTGIRLGGAEISKLNGNFIINIGDAEAAHVVSLVGMIQERVYLKFKVKLETAVRILGVWQKSKLRIKD